METNLHALALVGIRDVELSIEVLFLKQTFWLLLFTGCRVSVSPTSLVDIHELLVVFCAGSLNHVGGARWTAHHDLATPVLRGDQLHVFLGNQIG